MRLIAWIKSITRPGTEEGRAVSLDGLTRGELVAKVNAQAARIETLEKLAVKLRGDRAELMAEAESAKRAEQVWKAALDGVYQLEKKRNAELIFAQEAAARGFQAVIEADKPIPKRG